MLITDNRAESNGKFYMDHAKQCKVETQTCGFLPLMSSQRYGAGIISNKKRVNDKPVVGWSVNCVIHSNVHTTQISLVDSSPLVNPRHLTLHLKGHQPYIPDY
jgi:hypothetical protein